MTKPAPIDFQPERGRDLAAIAGTLVVFADGEGKLGPAAAAIDEAAGGAFGRAVADPEFKAKPGTVRSLRFPAGVAADSVILACLGDAPDRAAARKTGGAIAKALGKGDLTICTAGIDADKLTAELVWAVVLRLYDFREYKTADDDNSDPGERAITVLTGRPAALHKLFAPFAARAEGIFFTRDLVNEPANRLTTDEFAARLAAMTALGIEVEVLGEDALEKLGARALLAVGQGSASESKIVVMKWMGSRRQQKALALVGKGVVFDTGGISIKSAGGMEEMTMDMGGAGVVAGVMRTLA
ncbi:MAG: M17 family metallopeptidase, partial [Paracoccaceae bacterium]